MSRVVNIGEVRQRKERLVDRQHLAYVATFPCCICGHRPVEVHHLLVGEDVLRGTGLKADDRQSVPLCPDHHRQLHAAPQSFQAKYGGILEETAKRLDKQNPREQR